jgi:hypothetical protein
MQYSISAAVWRFWYGVTRLNIDHKQNGGRRHKLGGIRKGGTIKRKYAPSNIKEVEYLIKLKI